MFALHDNTADGFKFCPSISKYLFLQIRVLVDTMRYEDNSLNERAMKLLVMIRSPTNRLLELLPKVEIIKGYVES